MRLIRTYGIALVSSALVLGAPASVAYLVGVGPPPLRLQAAVVPRIAADVLPPLVSSDVPTSAAIVTTDAPAPAPTPVEQETPPPQETQAETNQAQAVVAEAKPEPEIEFAPAYVHRMAPQMLLPYFAGSTNQQILISTPVEFQPPPPPARRGSSAVYVKE